ncbi:MAG TPA: efflux RND transporter periplasmic adaptor subunit [Mesorhizobium sp.]|jgi:RND family efflux transporter MFP subunit|nr:efflux RND transporter periplasmic adaptor subunit [Mesorhizobium sp.]
MSFWKQIALSIAIPLVAFAGWIVFFPGAPEVLARWGIEWASASAPASEQPLDGGRAGRKQGGGLQASVITAPVTIATINDKLSAIGTGRAKSSVIVKPYATGRLTEISVVSGTEVTVGTVIAKLESEGEQIALDRARIALDDAEAKLERIKTLRSSSTATAVQVREAELALDNARLQLRDADLALERRNIVAPIAGIVGILPITAGNYVTVESEIATIDDRSTIIIDFWVPERYASAIKVGATLTAVPIARPGEMFQGTVSAVDNRIDEASRTLRVRADIGNQDDTLRAGMSFQVSMRFAGDNYPSVDPLAVQWGADGAFVWAIVDGKAKRTPVRIVQRNTESVLVEAALGAGEQVVTEGIHAVREGAEVQIAAREPTVPPAVIAPAATGGS